MSSYVLDSSSPTVALLDPAPTIAYNQLFYQSPGLNNGQHTLVITKLDGGPLWLDYFQIIPDTNKTFPPQPPLASSLHHPGRTTLSSIDRTDQVTATTSSPTVPIPSMTISATEVATSNFQGLGSLEVPSSASVTNTALSSPSKSPMAASSPAGMNSSALVGGLIGGVIFLLCILASVWLFYKRKATAEAKNSHGALRHTCMFYFCIKFFHC